MKIFKALTPFDLYAAFLILGVGPIVMLLLPGIPFANDGHCDPWYIFGLHYNFSELLQWYPNRRQIARVPEILPGYFFTQNLPGVTADYALFLFYYVISLFFVYRTARQMMSAVPSLLSTISFGTNPLILGNYSATLDAPAIAYDAICLYLTVRAALAPRRGGRLTLIFCSGLALGVTLHAYLGMATFAFANYLTFAIFVLLNGRNPLASRVSELAAAAFLTLIGVGIATIGLGLVLIVFGGHFGEILNQIWAVPAVSKNAANYFWKEHWYLEGSVTGLLILAGGVAIINVINSGARAAQTPNITLAFSISLILLIAAQLLYNEMGGVFIQYDYYYCFIIPYITLIIFTPLDRIRAGPTYSGLFGVTLFLLGSLALITIKLQDLPQLYATPARALVTVGLAILAVFSCAILAVSARYPRPLITLYLVILLALTAVVVRPTQVGVGIWSNEGTFSSADEYYGRVRRGLEFLHAMKFTHLPKFWIDRDLGPAELPAYPRSYHFCSYFQFPDPTSPKETNLESFEVGDDVVVVSKLIDLPEAAKLAFEQAGMKVSERAKESIALGSESYQIIVEHVDSINEQVARPWTSEPPLDAEVVTDAFGPPAGSGVISQSNATRFQIKTPPQRWAYAAVLPIERTDLRGPLWIEIELKVLEGEIGVGVEDLSRKNFLKRQSVGASTGAVKIDLAVRTPTPIGNLVFQSWQDPQSSRIEVERVSVLKPRQ